MASISFTPFPSLRTNRLSLRKIKPSDDHAVFLLRSNDSINQYIDRPKANNIEESRAFIEKINSGIELDIWIYWAVCIDNIPDLIGAICLWNFSEERSSAEIGFELHPDFQGKGFMHEAVAAVCNYAFEKLGLKRIEAFTNKANNASIKLLGKNGFLLNQTATNANQENLLVFELNR